MEHVNAKYLRALADGKVIEYRYPNLGEDYLWWQTLDHRSIASNFLGTGIQDEDPLWHVELRIKPEETE